MIPTTTLAEIRKHSPCESGWRQLLKNLGGIRKYGEDTPVTLLQILDSNGLDDALWCLRACPDSDKFARAFARWCALQVIDLCDVPNVVREYLETGNEDLRDAARAAAWDAAWDAARDAAWAAARDAAWDAAWDAARDAAWAAARDSVWDAQEQHLREMCK